MEEILGNDDEKESYDKTFQQPGGLVIGIETLRFRVFSVLLSMWDAAMGHSLSIKDDDGAEKAIPMAVVEEMSPRFAYTLSI
ncbi:hypothetical protein Tco_1363024 [Tanacetum coccineum]